jgi:hypothetical protein
MRPISLNKANGGFDYFSKPPFRFLYYAIENNGFDLIKNTVPNVARLSIVSSLRLYQLPTRSQS